MMHVLHPARGKTSGKGNCSSSPGKKPWMCRFGAQGRCKFGDKCLYQHTQGAKAAPVEDEQESDAEDDAAATLGGPNAAADERRKPCRASSFGDAHLGVAVVIHMIRRFKLHNLKNE